MILTIISILVILLSVSGIVNYMIVREKFKAEITDNLVEIADNIQATFENDIHLTIETILKIQRR
jgi:ABC-type lipoprotein release transport system permease subunit